jgi:hypothetical protein
LAENQIDRLPALAAELVRQQTGGYPPVFAAKAATTTIPIVFLAPLSDKSPSVRQKVDSCDRHHINK